MMITKRDSQFFLATFVLLVPLSCAETKIEYRFSQSPDDYVGELWRYTWREQSGIAQVAFSPDGRLVAVGGWVSSARLLDVDSAQQVSTFTGHGDLLWQSRYFLAPAHLVSRLIWRPFGFTPLNGKPGGVMSVAFSPNGRFVVTGGIEDNTLRLWNTRSGLQTRVFGNVSSPMPQVWSVAFSPSGDQLASVGWDGIIRLWSVRTGIELWRIESNDWRVNQVRFVPAGTQIAACDDGGKVRFIAVSTKTIVKELSFQGPVLSLAFSDDGRRIAVALEDELHWVDLESGTTGGAYELLTASNPERERTMRRFTPTRRMATVNQPEQSVAWTSDGRYALACWEQVEISGAAELTRKGLALVDVMTGREVSRWEIKEFPHRVAISADGHLGAFVVGATLHLWKLPMLPTWAEKVLPVSSRVARDNAP
jgi:WD40 repeat protein